MTAVCAWKGKGRGRARSIHLVGKGGRHDVGLGRSGDSDIECGAVEEVGGEQEFGSRQVLDLGMWLLDSGGIGNGGLARVL